MSYVDGFVLAVPTANKQALIDHAGQFDPIFLEYGATRVLECWGGRRASRQADRLLSGGGGQGG